VNRYQVTLTQPLRRCCASVKLLCRRCPCSASDNIAKPNLSLDC
jgi:hypothetical protein